MTTSLCKTTILKFLVDKDTAPRLWNVSSTTRKRMNTILEEMEITVKEHNEKVLKLNGWVTVGEDYKYFESAKDIKKGVSNYKLGTQEEVDKVLSLNGKLRCYQIGFEPKTPLEVDFIKDLNIDPSNYDLYTNWSFNKVGQLYLSSLKSSQIKEVILKFKQIKDLKIESCSISDLDLRPVKISSVKINQVSLEGEVNLPFNLDCLDLSVTQNLNLLKPNKVTKVDVYEPKSNKSFDFIKKLKGIKEVRTSKHFLELVYSLPGTIRRIDNRIEFDEEDMEYSALNSEFPFLTDLDRKIPIEAAQTLNLRVIEPKMIETEEKFTLRPREIKVYHSNVKELNKHPELFERLRKIKIWTDKFNYDLLPGGMQEICFGGFEIEGEKLESLEKNNWKFEESVLDLTAMTHSDPEPILNSLKKIRAIRIDGLSKGLVEEYPQFRFIIK